MISKWLNKNGELKVVTRRQAQLAQSEEAQHVLSQFLFFKERGMTRNLQELSDNFNLAMEIEFERDAGLTSQGKLWEHKPNHPGF